MGSAKEIHHDPGAEGESGEGDAVIVKFCFMYLITFAVLVYERFLRNRDTGAEANAGVVQVVAAPEEGKEGKDVEADKTAEQEQQDEEARADAIAQAKWTEPDGDKTTDNFRDNFIRAASCNTLSI